MVDASVDGVLGKLLIDCCSNLSIVTKQYFEKLPGEYETVGKSRGRIQLEHKMKNTQKELLFDYQ